MANITSYPTVTPTGSDLVIGTDMSTTPISTKTFTIDSINSLAYDAFPFVFNTTSKTGIQSTGNTASGDQSTAMSMSSVAFGYASTSIGHFNVSNTGDNPTSYDATNTAFSIGNGTAEAARSDAFKVLFNGTTTIAGSVTSESLNVTALNAVPASATAAGTLGSIRFTADYIYICVATNTWKRVYVQTF